MLTKRGKWMTPAAGRRWAAVAVSLLCLIIPLPSPAQKSVKPAQAGSSAPHGQMFLQPASAADNDQSARCQPKVLAALLKKQVMPGVIGCNYSRVATIFTKSDFPEPQATAMSNKSPSGTIIRQYPKAGGQLMPGAKVQLFISTDPETAPADQVKPVPAPSAAQIAKNPKSVAVPDVSGSAEIAASPRALATVPLVTGRTPDQARAMLKAAGFAAGEPIPELALSEPGRISRQDPLAGSSFPSGQMVLLWRPYAWFSVMNLMVASLLILVLTMGGLVVHVRGKQRLRYTRRVVSIRASVAAQGERWSVPTVPLAKPMVALQARLQPGEVRFNGPMVIERQEIKQD